MQVLATDPQESHFGLLEGAQFADAFSVDTAETDLDAMEAARRIMARSPRWVTFLLMLRNLAVTPFGLKGAPPERTSPPGRIGFFPIVSQSPERVVLGFDDRHLDFRVIVDVLQRPAGQSVTTSTVVRTHNTFGRVYLAAVLPFHRRIVTAMLRQVARPDGARNG